MGSVVYTKSDHEHQGTNSVVVLIVLSRLVLGLFRELLLPDMVGCVLVQTGKEQVEYLRVPAHCMAFNALFDVLNNR